LLVAGLRSTMTLTVRFISLSNKAFPFLL
jgi:hypothetical protein